MKSPAKKENRDNSRRMHSPKKTTTKAAPSHEFRQTGSSTAFSDAWIEEEAAAMTADIIKKIQNCGQFAQLVRKIIK